ncbi:MAG: hypothetical protein R3B54_00950 [Bdellovibrionota bacterium]
MQIATANTFDPSNLRFDEVVSAESGRARVTLEPGTYYWRLSVAYPQFEIASPARRLTVESVKSIPIALVSPAQNTELALTDTTTFAWKFPVDNVIFEFELEQIREGQPVAEGEKRRLSAQTLNWKPSRIGDYRWRVSALHDEELLTQSDWQDFNVMDRRPLVLVGPEDKLLIGYWKELPEFTLEWEDIKTDKSQRYTVRVGTSPFLQEQTRSYNIETPYLKSSELKLANGNYYWNVVLESEEKETLRVSEIRSFSIGLHPLLQAPKEVFPKNKQTVNVVRFQGDPVLEWQPVESATQYEVKLLDKGGRELASAKTEATRFPLKAIKEGSYRWTVRAIDPLDRGGLPLPFKSFFITYGDPLKAPEILGSKVE